MTCDTKVSLGIMHSVLQAGKLHWRFSRPGTVAMALQAHGLTASRAAAKPPSISVSAKGTDCMSSAISALYIASTARYALHSKQRHHADTVNDSRAGGQASPVDSDQGVVEGASCAALICQEGLKVVRGVVDSIEI